jgi:hypothetical protein
VATVVPIIDDATGEQVVDAVTGYPMWLVTGDETGMVKLGDVCAVTDFVPLALPATGDGTAAPLVDEDDMLVP